jgi:hypothetical protein
MRPSLVLGGVGLFAGISVFLAGYRRRSLYALGAGYVVVQIVLWAVLNAREYTAVGYLDEAVQVVLLVLLVGMALAGRGGGS